MCAFGKGLRLGLVSMCVALMAQQALAALPSHPVVHTFEPTPTESVNPDGSPVHVTAGVAVAIRNDTALVGMPGINKVAIYKRTSTGWVRTHSLAAPESISGFGTALAYRDDTIVAAADTGAYVFKLINGTWRYTQKLLGEGAATHFEVLAYQDNMVLTGSPLLDRPGVAYVFELTAAGKLVRRLKLQPRDARANDGFGTDVAMSANLIVVGAPDSLDGAAYLFRRSSTGWSQSQRLIGQGSAREGFGTSVAVNNGIVLVGAPSEDSEWSSTEGLRAAAGAVFLFLPNSASSYAQAQRIRPSSAVEPNFIDFGGDIAMSGNRFVVVAVELIGGPGDYATGRAFTYNLTNNRAVALGLSRLTPPFVSVGLANKWLLVGQPYDGGCFWYGCVGKATLFDTDRLQ
jgi:FG-GAP repeat